MKETLKPGIKFEHRSIVAPSKTVPALYPEAQEFLAMPEVFATGFLVGFLEWACIKAVNPHLDWPLGRHERFVINKNKFDAKIGAKAHRSRS